MKTVIRKQRKNTKELFCKMYDSARKLRRTDPIQFEVIFHDWKRLRENSI